MWKRNRWPFLITQTSGRPATQDARATGASDILAITTRGDVRSDVLKELERQLTNLTDFQSKPGVDTVQATTFGGLLVPILRDYNFRDLAVDLSLEVILVAPNRLGVINHVLLIRHLRSN